MLRSFFIAASLTGLLFASGGAPVARASEALDTSNIGFVLYTKSGALWITDGKVSAVGVGMEVENGLAVGWRRVAD